MGSGLALVARHRDGTSVPVDVSLSPVHIGEQFYVLATLRDVAERRQLEQTLQQQHALLQHILDEIPGGVYLVAGPEAKLVIVNAALHSVFGARWPVGQGFVAFLAEHGIAKLSATGQTIPAAAYATLRALAQGETVRQEIEIIQRADGTHLPVLVNALPLDATQLPPLTQAPCALVILQDVTALQQAEQLKDEFLAIATHELRGPAAVLQGYASMLLRRSQAHLAKWQHEALEEIEIATIRLVDLTNDLLDVTHLQAGRLELQRDRFDLTALVEQVARQWQATTTHHVLACAAPAVPLTIVADRQRITQVLSNLVSNAIKYSPDGGRIDLGIERHATEVHITITDHGMGIPQAAQAHLFNRFMRAENARNNGVGGTGLGLFLCRQLLTLHGGHIWFTSHEGQGSTFYIALPIPDQEPSETVCDAQDQPPQ